MNFDWIDFLKIFGSIGIFIFGMKLMGESIRRAAGSKLKDIVYFITDNKWAAFFTGFFITALIQSSSIVTVMTVSFVNTSMITALESAGVIIGANLGSTITGWIVALFGFNENFSSFSLLIFAVAVPMRFLFKNSTKYWGEFLIGFAILILGLDFLIHTIPAAYEGSGFLYWIHEISDMPIINRLVFVIIGIILAIIVQSSGVAMAIIIAMAAHGWLDLLTAATLILGSNIGTTNRALLASYSAGREAKISARIHLFSNIIGALWMLAILPLFLSFVSFLLSTVFRISDIYTDPFHMAIGLAAFHTLFNLINGLLLINFSSFLTKIASLSVSDKELSNTKTPLFIGSTEVIPELAGIQIHKEISRLGEALSDISQDLRTILNNPDKKVQTKLIKTTKRERVIFETLENQITDYISDLLSRPLSEKTVSLFNVFIQLCSELSDISEQFRKMASSMEKKTKNKIFFLPDQRDSINNLFALINESIETMNKQLASIDYQNEAKYTAERLHREIGELEYELRKTHLTRMSDLNYNPSSSVFYLNMLDSSRQINERTFNITRIINTHNRSDAWGNN